MASEAAPDESIIMMKPSRTRLVLVMIGLCMAVFLTGMDQTILATAVPVISNEFNTSANFGWWSNAYLLTLSSFQLFYGKLYALFPIKHVYLAAIVLFEIGSLVCTTAPNSVALIVGRALAGLGAAGVFSGSVMTLAKSVPLAERAAYLGIMSAVFGLAAIVGPFLGAALIQSSTWRWCFGSLARSRDIWLAGAYAMCITGGVYVSVLYLPVWFQDVRGRSPLSSGAMLTPLIAGYVVASVVSGGLTSAIGYYNPAMIVGTAFAAAGSALLTTVRLDSSTARVVGYELVYGFGVGFGFGQPSYIVQTLLPPADVPIGVTFVTLVQNLSASVFTAVAQSIFQSEMRRRLAPLVPAADAVVLGSGLSEILASLPPQSQGPADAAISQSIVLTFYVVLALSCLSVVCLGIKWGSMKQPESSPAADDELPEVIPPAPEDAQESGSANGMPKRAGIRPPLSIQRARRTSVSLSE